MIKKTAIYAGLTILSLLIVLIINTLLFRTKQIDITYEGPVTVSEQSVGNLSRILQFKTVSAGDTVSADSSAFTAFHHFLEEAYPLVHNTMKKEKYHHFALLFGWEGKNSSLKPAVLMAHQDVVPAIDEDWDADPFSGEIKNDAIWGRGALDDKGSLVSIMEAAEKLLSEGFTPERTIYLAFGDDEEIEGNGARILADALKQKGVEAEIVLDEGMTIVNGIIPMISKPVATIGTSEKGFLSVRLSCEVEGGHSSMPQAETAISILSEAIVEITENQPAPVFSEPVKGFLSFIGPEIPWPAKIVFANRWLLGGVLKSIYASSGPGNATVRTTTAPTIISGGFKDNVLPVSAYAIINFRLLPGDPSSEIIDRLGKVIDDDRIKIEPIEGKREPAPVSPTDNLAFRILQKTINQNFKDILIAPTLMLGASDSRNYSVVSKNIYRFAPYNLREEDLESIHGKNERIRIDDFRNMIGFYYRFIKNLQRE